MKRNWPNKLAAATLAVLVISLLAASIPDPMPAKVGTQGSLGCGPDAKLVKRLVISEPGVYENFLMDGEWGDSTLVKINADGVTLRRCEIRHGRQLDLGLAVYSPAREDAPCALFAPLHYEANYAYPLLVWLHGPDDDENQLKRLMPY